MELGLKSSGNTQQSCRLHDLIFATVLNLLVMDVLLTKRKIKTECPGLLIGGHFDMVVFVLMLLTPYGAPK